MNKLTKTLGLLGAIGVLSLGILASSADARGRVYISRNPQTGAIEKYISAYETAGPRDIVVLEYEPMLEGNGSPYQIKATGHFTSEYFIVQHGEIQGTENAQQDFPDAEFQMLEDDRGFKLVPSKNIPQANKFFKNCIPGHYEYYDNGVLMPSEFAMKKLLLEQVPYDFSGIDQGILLSDPAYYQFHSEFIADLHAVYPDIPDTGFGCIINVTAGGKPYEKQLNTFIIDGKMENIWRFDNDGTLFQVYGLDGVG